MPDRPPGARPLRRVCLSPGSIGGGGIGMVTLALARAFVARGLAVDILVIGADPLTRPVPPGARLIHIADRSARALPALVRYLRAERPDLIIAARDYINLAMLAAHRLARLGRASTLVWTFHTYASADLPAARLPDRIAGAILRRLLHLPDRLVAVSGGVARDLEGAGRLPPGTVQVIRNPVWSDVSDAAAQAPCPHRWLGHRPPHAPPAPPGEQVIIGVGRLVAQKDFPTLLRALALIPAPAPCLILLGDGPERAALTRLVADLGLGARVDMPGQVPNPLSYMSRADLFVLSSRWEGFPLALAEALGCGAAIVATDCPTGPAEILAGGHGALIPPGDPEAMATAIMATLTDPPPRDRQSAAGRRFDVETAAAAYLALAR